MLDQRFHTKCEIGLLQLLLMLTVTAAINWSSTLSNLHSKGEQAPIPLSLTNFSWNGTDLTICAAENLAEDDENILQLTYITATNDTEYNIAGLLSEESPKCAVFCLEENPFITEVQTYALVVKEENDNVKLGTASFSVQITVDKISCEEGSDLYRISDDAEPSSLSSGSDCLSSAGVVDSICYQQTTDVICYTPSDSEPPDIVVCQSDLIPDEDAIIADGTFTIDSLNYDESSLSYTFSGDVEVTIAELIVFQDEKPLFVCMGTDTTCTYPALAPSNNTNPVCALTLDSLEEFSSLQSGTIQDINLSVNNAGATLQFSFTNTNPGRIYISTIYPADDDSTTPSNSVTLDCTRVDHGTTCYGFFDVLDTPLCYITVALEDKTFEVTSVSVECSSTSVTE